MSKKKRIDDDDDFDQEEFDGGEMITVSNGSKTIEVSRKAFKSTYENKGFREAGGDDFDERYSPDEKALGRGGRGRLAGSESDEDELTPQQKAARTRAANKDKDKDPE